MLPQQNNTIVRYDPENDVLQEAFKPTLLSTLFRDALDEEYDSAYASVNVMLQVSRTLDARAYDPDRMRFVSALCDSARYLNSHPQAKPMEEVFRSH